MMNEQKLADIRARLDARQQLIQRETEIRDLPAEEITSELEEEAYHCWMEYDRVTWSDNVIAALLRMIDQQQAVINTARRLVHPVKRFGYCTRFGNKRVILIRCSMMCGSMSDVCGR